MASSSPPWSELPPDILGLVIDRLPSDAGRRRRSSWSAACSRMIRSLLDSLACFGVDSNNHTADSDDRAHFRAAYRSWIKVDSVDVAHFRAAYRAHRTVNRVCRSWRAASCERLPRPPLRLPWILANSYFFRASSDDAWGRRIPSLPKNASCIGSTDDWIALCCVARKACSYLLHNPFSDTTVRLPELDAVIGNNVHERFEVRKALMRSTPRDVIALMTNNGNCPIILVRPGKGVWLPRPQSAPFVYIIDIAFIGDRLYGVTQAEDLISLDIAFGADDMPTVTKTKRVIRHPSTADDSSAGWSIVDRCRVILCRKLDAGYDLWSDVDEKYHKYDAKDKAYHALENLNGEHDNGHARYEMMKSTDRHFIYEGIHCEKTDDLITTVTTWQIVESLGKLLMVRRKLYCPRQGDYYTRNADVFEADITAGAWVPVTHGLDGQALFISRYCCKSIHACGEVEKDAVYFVDTGEVLRMKTRIISQPQRNLHFRWTTWLFPPEPVH